MSYIEEERPKIRATMDMFVAMKQLTDFYSVDQAMEIMDRYLKTGDEGCIMTYDGVRDFVAKSKIRDTFQPIYDEGYNHLADYINDIIPAKGITK